MDFRILGPLEVAGDGAPLVLGAVQQRAVLAVLVLHRGEVVSTDRLVDELWGERPPAAAAKTVQVYVSHLRKALGAGVIVTQGRGYRLAVAPEQVDAVRFEALAGEGRRALAGGDAARAKERLRGQLMLALYRTGRQADALAAYRQTSELLREELGLEPSRLLQELERSI